MYNLTNHFKPQIYRDLLLEKSNAALFNQSKVLHIAVKQSVWQNVLESQSQAEVSSLSQSQLQTLKDHSLY